MIEVRAKLIRGPAFFAGEKIASCISFRHVPGKSDDSRATNSRESETLAWASAQIVCLCSINPQKVSDPSFSATKSHHGSSATSTSLSPSRGEHGCVIYSTKPKILVCDLSLSSGQLKDCIYEEIVPFELPPSYRGQAVKYSYKLKIGLQRVGAAVKMLHLPLRLMMWQALEVPTYNDEEEPTRITNPFLNSSPRNCQLDQALEVMQVLSSRRSPSVYKVTNSLGKVVNLCLFKTSYRLGEDIVGTLDFTDAVVSCMQYSVTLQSEETVAEGKRRKTGHATSGEESVIVAHSKHHEFSVGYQQTHISLPIPLHVTPSFSTNLVTLKWRLHFEFVTTIKPIEWNGESGDWQPPKVVDIETMVWDFPIVVYPTAPAHVSKALYIQREATVTL